MGNIDDASAAIYFSLLVYSISIPYSLSMGLPISTLSVFLKHVRFYGQYRF